MPKLPRPVQRGLRVSIVKLPPFWAGGFMMIKLWALIWAPPGKRGGLGRLLAQRCVLTCLKYGLNMGDSGRLNKGCRIERETKCQNKIRY